MFKSGVIEEGNGCSHFGSFVLKSYCALAQIAIAAATIEKQPLILSFGRIREPPRAEYYCSSPQSGVFVKQRINGTDSCRIRIKVDAICINRQPTSQSFVDCQGIVTPLIIVSTLTVNTYKIGSTVGKGFVIVAPRESHLVYAENGQDQGVGCGCGIVYGG